MTSPSKQEIERIARGLSVAQERTLKRNLNMAEPNDMRALEKEGLAASKRVQGPHDNYWRVNRALTPLGLQVRAHLARGER